MKRNQLQNALNQWAGARSAGLHRFVSARPLTYRSGIPAPAVGVYRGGENVGTDSCIHRFSVSGMYGVCSVCGTKRIFPTLPVYTDRGYTSFARQMQQEAATCDRIVESLISR